MSAIPFNSLRPDSNDPEPWRIAGPPIQPVAPAPAQELGLPPADLSPAVPTFDSDPESRLLAFLADLKRREARQRRTLEMMVEVAARQQGLIEEALRLISKLTKNAPPMA